MTNSFLKQKFEGVSVLILAPHQDDEVHVAGGLLSSFTDAGADVYVVYTTNGDYKFLASTRYREAIKALKIAGVPKDNVVFLGYADGCINRKHIFYTEDKPQISIAGYVHTYGVEDFPDYSWNKRHKHSSYTKNDYEKDLENVILDIMPDVILCVDYDHHCDHRMLSVSFDSIMGKILCEQKGKYTPLVYKILSYAVAYEAKPDFYAVNILSVPKPVVGEVLGYDMDILDYSMYDWEQRVRFPVNTKCRGRFLHDNILFRALTCHYSQGAAMHAEYCINGDIVYWQRRTDNLLNYAQLSANCGNPNALKEFRLYAVKSIFPIRQQLEFEDSMWEVKDEAELNIFWDEPQLICQLVFWGNINRTGNVEKILIEFDNGEKSVTGALPKCGKAYIINLPTKVLSSYCRIKILKKSGVCGINYLGIYSDKYQKGVIKPFIKILINGDFAYDYWIKRNVRDVSINLYRYACDDDIEIKVVSNCFSKYENDVLTIDDRDGAITVRAVSKVDENIFDEIVIVRKSYFSLFKLWLLQRIEKRVIKFLLRRLKKYTYLRNRYLKDI